MEMEKNKTPEPNTNNYASLCCYSPVIPLTQIGVGVSLAEVSQCALPCQQQLLTIAESRYDKSQWLCDYSDDIFQTFRETELRRNIVCFQSIQCGFRPVLLRLLKVATEVHKLSRTTLHLAVYLLDCFMDNYTIRTEKLNLTAITCLIVAAKIEEADMNTPKFVELNKLVGNVYTLADFRNAELKVLILFNFDLIRPTAATFAEYFSNNIVTLDDFHIYWQNWHSGIFNYRPLFQQQLSASSFLALPPLYNTYEEMATNLSKLLFNLVDESLSYLKFVNARPSVIAAACVAAARHLSFITPTWTPYLVKITECTQDIIEPFMEALIALHNMHLNKDRIALCTSDIANSTVLCDSPDSGFVSVTDTKSDSSDNESVCDEEHSCAEYSLPVKRRRPVYLDNESDEDGDSTNNGYPLLEKKRRML